MEERIIKGEKSVGGEKILRKKRARDSLLDRIGKWWLRERFSSKWIPRSLYERDCKLGLLLWMRSRV
jgi:hypothetical protein